MGLQVGSLPGPLAEVQARLNGGADRLEDGSHHWSVGSGEAVQDNWEVDHHEGTPLRQSAWEVKHDLDDEAGAAPEAAGDATLARGGESPAKAQDEGWTQRESHASDAKRAAVLHERDLACVHRAPRTVSSCSS